MGSCLQQLVRDIETYHLDRFRDVWPVIAKIRCGRMSEDEARRCLIGLQPLIQQQIDLPNLLHPPPDAEQLAELGKPDFEFLTLENELRTGLKITDRPRHVACFGDTGSGKTTCIRQIIKHLDGIFYEEASIADNPREETR